MAFPLAPGVHLAVVDDDVVLLDVPADRYLCVPDGRRLLRPSPARDVVDPEAPGVVEALAAARLLSQSASRPPAPPPRPGRDLPAEPPRMAPRDAARLAGAVWDGLRRYRGRSLDEIVAFTRRSRPARPGDPIEVVRLATVFRDAVVWLPLPRKCLIRSFVLLRFLQRSGVDATWVFGVRTWPFSAHCWLQRDDLVLDDFAERLVAYEPIFAVG